MAMDFWVCSEHDLETTVKNEAIYFITSHTTANTV
jgi:hypothetical protein